MDGRKNNGGARKGAGRPPKADEEKLIEKLGKFEDKALAQLEKSVEEGQSWAIKLFMEYMYGKPREKKDISIKEIPTINMEDWK